MNCGRQREKLFHTTAAFLAVLAVLTFAVAAIPAQAQTYKVAYNFGSHTNDPITPGAGPNFIAQGRDGSLYSMSWQGGSDGRGAAFKVTPSGELTVLANFVISNGDYPIGGLTLGADGNLYGTTNQGGDPNCNLGLGCGTVLKLTPAGKLTTLFVFPADNSNGSYPGAAPVQGSDGNFYGTTSVGLSGSTLYKMTPTGTMILLHQFNTNEGNDVVAGLVEGTDGSFYGGSFSGGTNGDGVLFKVTPSGSFTVLHNFTGSDGSSTWGLIQATDGNFYGVTGGGGTSKAGVVFKITPGGAYTVLHNLNGTTDGISPYSSLVQATDGNFYGVANGGGSLGFGTIFKVTSRGVYSVVHNFDGKTGQNPESALTQDTNGILYGDTYRGGSGSENCNGSCGVLYSLKIGAAPFIKLVSDSGKVGSQIGILGQGFSSASVVKFNGLQATTVTRTGTTFLLATVPAGASDGKVTVTTGSTTLTSPQTFIVHNSWRSGTALPTARMGAAAGAIGSDIYVVGGYTLNGAIGNNDIYNPEKNSWTSGAADPDPRAFAAYAVVNKKLYMFGGSNGSALLNVAEAYDPATNSWSTLAPVPYVSETASAVADKDVIYVIGGQDYNGYLTNVESYNTTTNTWTDEAPLPGAQGWAAVGLLGTTVVAADGSNGSINLGVNQAYNVTNNTWSELTPDPTPRTPGCYGVINGKSYVAGGLTQTMITLNEAYNPGTKAWATVAPMPQAPGIAAGSAVDGGNLYCFGGGIFLTNVYDYVQIYQP
jgi:uncharacterized repeat protein (TIGR03803 family)